MRVRPRGEGKEVRACNDEGCPCEIPHAVEDCCRVRTCMCAYVGQERAWAEGSRSEARGGMPVAPVKRLVEECRRQEERGVGERVFQPKLTLE